MIGNTLKSLIFLTLTAFALIGAASVLPESAWDKAPAKLRPVRTFLADNGLIAAPDTDKLAKNADVAADIAATPVPVSLDGKPAAPLSCPGGICPVRLADNGAKNVDSVRLTLGGGSKSAPAAPGRLDVRPPEPLILSEQTTISPATIPPATLPQERALPAPTLPAPMLAAQEAPAQEVPSPLSADTLPDLSFDEAHGTVSPAAVSPAAVSSATVSPAAVSPANGPAAVPNPTDLAWSDSGSGDSSDGVSAVSGVTAESLTPPSLADTPLAQNDLAVRRLDAAIARSVEPSATAEVFLELNRILAEQGEFLSPNDRVRLNLTLDRLAFDVFYNPKVHLLEPEYVVAEGETFEQIARKYDISPEFLAVVNQSAIPGSAPLAAGTRLKVVRGPVGAQVSFKRMELLLTFNGLYAGRFKMGCTERAQAVRGSFAVTRKVVRPEYNGPLDNGLIGKIPAGDPRNPLGPCWIELAGGLGLQGTNRPEYIGQAIAPVGGLIFSNQDITHLNILLGNGAAVQLVD